MSGKKVFLTSLIISALLIAIIFGAGIIIAQTSGNHFGLHSMLKGAKYGFKSMGHKHWGHKKFNVNKKLEWISEKLDKAVKEGKITEQQKQTILAKNAEMFNKMKELKSSGKWEEMKDLKQEFTKWAEKNDIDLSDIYGKSGKWKKGAHFKGLH